MPPKHRPQSPPCPQPSNNPYREWAHSRRFHLPRLSRGPLRAGIACIAAQPFVALGARFPLGAGIAFVALGARFPLGGRDRLCAFWGPVPLGRDRLCRPWGLVPLGGRDRLVALGAREAAAARRQFQRDVDGVPRIFPPPIPSGHPLPTIAPMKGRENAAASIAAVGGPPRPQVINVGPKGSAAKSFSSITMSTKASPGFFHRRGERGARCRQALLYGERAESPSAGDEALSASRQGKAQRKKNPPADGDGHRVLID